MFVASGNLPVLDSSNYSHPMRRIYRLIVNIKHHGQPLLVGFMSREINRQLLPIGPEISAERRDKNTHQNPTTLAYYW